MQPSMLKLILSNFVSRMALEFPAAGQPCLRVFEARCIVLIEALPEDVSPITFNETTILIALEWIFASLIKTSHDDQWAMAAIHSLRLHAIKLVPAILRAIVTPVAILATGVDAIL